MKYGFAHCSARTEFAKKRFGPEPEDPAEKEKFAAQPGPECLQIRRIMEGGLMHEWNRSHPDARVRAGDSIIEVNEETTIEGMQPQLRAEAIKLRIRRYNDRFSVLLARTPEVQKLGFKFRKREHEGGAFEVKITEISVGGLLDVANEEFLSKGKFHMVLCPGMRIEAVNDAEGDADLIAAELRNSQSLQLRVRRPEADYHSHRARAHMDNLSSVMMQQGLLPQTPLSMPPATPISRPATGASGDAAFDANADGFSSPSRVSSPNRVQSRGQSRSGR